MTANSLTFDYEYLFQKVDALTDERLKMLPSEWAEKKRILPPGLSPVPGPWKKDLTPYLIEMLDCFSPLSPVQEVAVMKGTQIGASVSLVENIIGYTIDHNPAPIMLVSSDEQLLDSTVELRIDRMIQESGLQHKIFSQSKSKISKKSGDTKKKKEFPGGFLITASARSGSQLRSFSIKILLRDEIDAAPREVGKEGSFLDVSKRRTDSFEAERKILDISTPLMKNTSNIFPLYEQGDQRKYFVPCPFCGEKQEILFENLKYEVNEGKTLIYESVYYECIKCDGRIKNYHKYDMLNNGEWRPTAEAKRPGMRSYHISSLYSPVGFKSWETIVEDWILAQDAKRNGDILPLKAFMNLTLAQPWEERGEAPRWEIIQATHRSSYTAGTVPEDVLFLTAGADVQGNRVEIEIVGWTKDFISYSIDYKVCEGDHEDIENISSKIWLQADEILSKEYLSKNGKIYSIRIAFIDQGYKSSVVRDFCRQYNSVFPIRGERSNLKWARVFKAYDTDDGIVRFDLDVSALKDQIYTQLKRGQNEDGEYPGGFCHFPADYSSKYFKMLTSEEKVYEKNSYGNVRIIWKKKYKSGRNEVLDLRVYNLGAVHVFADDICTKDLKLEKIVWSSFWDYIDNVINN